MAAFVLTVFYLVGFYGLMFSPYQSFFLTLVPFNLLLTNVILFYFHQSFSRPFAVFAAVVFTVGFLAEIVGIHTALLFGHYHYGAALGFKLAEVPVLIGLNWLMLVYSAGHLVNFLPVPGWVKAVLAAILMVALDYFIEPVAVHLDFWQWQNGHIPLSNFIGWLGVALVLQFYFQYSRFPKNNQLAPFVFLLQFLFFAALRAVL
ncbi:MAG: Carotenoid biosynthesis protein [uncultured Adhaeribacter sp.]|uniref:Carotenoid biosynthesis protein n=1 Tax=uncultured Adhaeribacter sp. TaxID=448109 RepID=A0A6J4JYJ4_9BACT|nr:MAG: Carotenoid biosynthesis protein [uncultured Adhaeribacter sp.]